MTLLNPFFRVTSSNSSFESLPSLKAWQESRNWLVLLVACLGAVFKCSHRLREKGSAKASRDISDWPEEMISSKDFAKANL